jgi:hypothetical protein
LELQSRYTITELLLVLSGLRWLHLEISEKFTGIIVALLGIAALLIAFHRIPCGTSRGLTGGAPSIGG